MINARAETLGEKPSFRNAFQKRRCMILADGFYEWQKPASGKGKSQPYYFRRKDGKPFAFAGLWEVWQPGDDAEPLKTCTIITTSANDIVVPVHDRMPVILASDDAWAWMAAGDLQQLLAPFNQQMLEAYPVGSFVNNPSIDSQVCIEPQAALF
jgi:putative SOS response-associated peptidase YedK